MSAEIQVKKRIIPKRLELPVIHGPAQKARGPFQPRLPLISGSKSRCSRGLETIGSICKTAKKLYPELFRERSREIKRRSVDASAKDCVDIERELKRRLKRY